MTVRRIAGRATSWARGSAALLLFAVGHGDRPNERATVPAGPDYATVFPQDKVNTIEIVLAPAQWTAIRADMHRLFGFEFGSGGVGKGALPEDDPGYQAITLRFNGQVWKNAGFRLKGGSSLTTAWRQGNEKLPFRLKMDAFKDSLPAVATQRFHGFRELSFSPGFADPSLLREKVMADLLREGGVPAARTAFYRVVIDFGAGPRYCGVYTVVEVVDDTMIRDQFGEDGGNLYKPRSNLTSFDPKLFEKKNHQAQADWSDIRAFLDALVTSTRTTNPAQWRAGLEAAFNVDHFLKWLAINNALVNWDTYGALPHNYYLYHHSTRGLTWIPWDHNMALSGTPGVTASPGGNPRAGRSLDMQEVGSAWPLLYGVARDSVYFARYRAYLRTAATTLLAPGTVNPMLDRYRALIAPHVTGPEGERPGATYTSPGGFASGVTELKSHLAARRALIASWVP